MLLAGESVAGGPISVLCALHVLFVRRYACTSPRRVRVLRRLLRGHQTELQHRPQLGATRPLYVGVVQKSAQGPLLITSFETPLACMHSLFPLLCDRLRYACTSSLRAAACVFYATPAMPYLIPRSADAEIAAAVMAAGVAGGGGIGSS
jgi:hypothetical protein